MQNTTNLPLGCTFEKIQCYWYILYFRGIIYQNKNILGPKIGEAKLYRVVCTSLVTALYIYYALFLPTDSMDDNILG